MKRRYIICFDDVDAVQSKLIIQDLKKKGLAWWHWIDDVWFVVDKKGIYSAKEIRDDLKNIAKQRLIVIELNDKGDTWAGLRANDPEKKMFTWFKNVWKM